jgi:hypothetical protein
VVRARARVCVCVCVCVTLINYVRCLISQVRELKLNHHVTETKQREGLKGTMVMSDGMPIPVCTRYQIIVDPLSSGHVNIEDIPTTGAADSLHEIQHPWGIVCAGLQTQNNLQLNNVVLIQGPQQQYGISS